MLGCAFEARASGLDAQRIVARKSVELLPEDLAVLFRRHADELQERVVEPDAVWRQDKDFRDRLDWHRVAMDISAQEQTFDARMAAARNFPRDRAATKRLYRRLNKPGGRGLLPWVIEDYYNQLADAFRTGSERDVVRLAAYLVHFAADAAGPFNATANFDGKLTGNLHLGRVRLGHPHHAHRSVAQRFGSELVRRNRSRYGDSLKMSPGDYEPVDEPLTRVRSVLLGSLAVLDEITAADAEIIELMRIADGAALVARADEYYQLLDERCGAICVDRLRMGAVFAANLIGGAWVAGGKPEAGQILQRSNQGEAPSEPSQPETPPDKAGKDARYVGSRHTQVYHLPSCTWAKKIAPENVVLFESVADAEEQGRRACRICGSK
jgi:hypothetical protein